MNPTSSAPPALPASTSSPASPTSIASRGHIDLIVPPFSGHLHPLLGIGRRLARDGLRVRVISTSSAAARTHAAGLESHCLMPGKDDAIHAIAEPPETVRSNPFRLNAQLRANLALLGQFQSELRALYRQSPPPSLAIVDFVLPIAGFVAREAGVPWWTSCPSPCALETVDGPPSYVGGWMPRDDLFGRIRDAAGRLLVRGFKRSVTTLHRRSLRSLGFPGLYRADGSEAIYSDECVLALGLRELEFARQWPAAVRFTGPVRYTPPGLGVMPAFRPGRAHVLVSLGTHLRAQKERVAAAVRIAAEALPHIEFHFTDGRPAAADAGRANQSDPAYQSGHGPESGRTNQSDPAGQPNPANFQRLPFIDYTLLSRYDLVVHHAGAGVLYETMAAGLPAIVWPLDYDQFDNAARLRAARLATPLGSLDDLPHTIERALAAAQSPDAIAVRHHYRSLVLRGCDAESSGHSGQSQGNTTGVPSASVIGSRVPSGQTSEDLIASLVHRRLARDARQ